jgi:hypothetical protein
LYYRQLRRTVATVFAPELTSATAKDAVGLVDRILAEFVVEEEWAPALSQEFGAEFEALLDLPVEGAEEVVAPARFVELRSLAAEFVADSAGSDDPPLPRARRRVATDRPGRGARARRVRIADGVLGEEGGPTSVLPGAVSGLA